MGLISKDKIEGLDDVQDSRDTLGGGGVFDTGSYQFTITMAYLMESESGASGILFQLEDEDQRKLTLREWFLSGNAKGNKPYYETQNGEKRWLPGFEVCRDILALCSEPVDIWEVDTEERSVAVYDAEKQAEVQKDMQVITEILGATVILGLHKQLEDQYKEPTKSREVNVVHKTFECDTLLTYMEKEKGIEEGAFHEGWCAKYNSEFVNDQRDKSKNSDGAAKDAGVGGAGEAPAKTGSLFKKKK